MQWTPSLAEKSKRVQIYSFWIAGVDNLKNRVWGKVGLGPTVTCLLGNSYTMISIWKRV